MNHQFTNTFYRAKVDGQYIHQSLQCLTPNPKWAWVGDSEKVRKAKRKCALFAHAKVMPIINNIKLQSDGILS